ncbi:MAG: hypothetical protein AAGB10_17410 [Pseudomonadota bacterium]
MRMQQSSFSTLSITWMPNGGSLETARFQRLREAIVVNSMESDYRPFSAAHFSLRSGQRLALSDV